MYFCEEELSVLSKNKGKNISSQNCMKITASLIRSMRSLEVTSYLFLIMEKISWLKESKISSFTKDLTS